MSNYIKLVQNQAELTAFKVSNDFVTPNVTMIYNNRKIYYNPIHDYSKDYFTFVPQESGTFKFKNNSINYSIDNGKTWTTLASNTDSPTISIGNKIMWKAELTPTSSKGIGTFSSTGSFIAQGNVMSLIYGDNFIGQMSLSGKSYAFRDLFNNCMGLTSTKNMSLPTTLGNYCYYQMFAGCSSLTVAPELLATTLGNYCYYQMFAGCSSLTTAPELPATTLASSCYRNMFIACSRLTTAPSLPATTLASNCYDSMFQGCTSLTTAPELPATTLAYYCYNNMFMGCTSLTTAPELPATTLTEGCYRNMFVGCGSLIIAPELPATTLANECYAFMFQGCTNLNSITCLATDISASSCTSSWVSGVAASGTFIKADSMADWTTGVKGIPSGWTVKDKNASQYLTFVAQESGTFKFTGNSINYSVDDGETWTSLASNVDSPTISSGDKIMFKAVLTPTSSKGIGTFSSTGSFTAQGNIMSLLYGDNFIGQTSLSGKNYAFMNLFKGCINLTNVVNLALVSTTLSKQCYSGMFKACTSLTVVPKLLATILAEGCYFGMFDGCTSLITAPELPATILAIGCYNQMFNGCSGLINGPVLPATTLANYCYQNMFDGCTSLTTAPELPATTLSDYCYRSMFSRCSSLTTAPSLSATTLTNGCYEYMFFGCTLLTTAPELPATTLKDDCYRYMFGDCTSLTSAPVLSATTLANNCYQFMFTGCRSLTTAPELPATTLTSGCYQYMFTSCTSLTTAPELPATTLVDSCYYYMFAGCTNLNNITCLATDISASNCTGSWVPGVAASGTFIKADSMTDWTTGNNGIPSGWTVQDKNASQYLTFVAEEDGTFKFTGNSINYSVDDGYTWTSLSSNTNTPTINAGDKIMWKAALTPTSYNGIGKFSATGRFIAQGNPMSLLYEDNFKGKTSLSGKNFSFYQLFYYCASLTNAKNLSLSATTLAKDCYASMFDGCTSLTGVPELPATTLAEDCYRYMFSNCASLATAPELHATTLVSGCYTGMFHGCTSLTTAPSLPATTLVDYSYNSMFSGCTSLTTAPALPATTLKEWCYYGMFQNCTSLTTAPELPVTTLKNWCYGYMFKGCTSLTTAPSLPATTLADYCYYNIFKDCTNLNSITCLATDISATYCTNTWVDGVAASGTFIKDPSMTGWTTDNNGIPSGWTVQNAA